MAGADDQSGVGELCTCGERPLDEMAEGLPAIEIADVDPAIPHRPALGELSNQSFNLPPVSGAAVGQAPDHQRIAGGVRSRHMQIACH